MEKCRSDTTNSNNDKLTLTQINDKFLGANFSTLGYKSICLVKSLVCGRYLLILLENVYTKHMSE